MNHKPVHATLKAGTLNGSQQQYYKLGWIYLANRLNLVIWVCMVRILSLHYGLH